MGKGETGKAQETDSAGELGIYVWKNESKSHIFLPAHKQIQNGSQTRLW